MQRYKFESNSQQFSTVRTTGARCVYLCKDTNLKAIHNYITQQDRWACVVFTYAKIQIWKQFTTRQPFHRTKSLLYLPMQRYKFESNSQHYESKVVGKRSCVYLCKDTNLKAIHNLIHLVCPLRTVVFTYAKIQIWKQFTTHEDKYVYLYQLCLPMQRYKFESNSQHDSARSEEHGSCVYLCKDTNLKAIHNFMECVPYDYKLCLPMQRYKFESNSQRLVDYSSVYIVVFTYAKIQIWKQFTTYTLSCSWRSRLCLPMQRYKFESNSQQVTAKTTAKTVVFTYAKIQIWKQFTTISQALPPTSGCVYLCKDTNLKAIHNNKNKNKICASVVFTYAKIQIWKQFTTGVDKSAHGVPLCLPMQRYKFESNSQPVIWRYQ